MIRSLFFSSKGSLQTGLDEAEFRSALRDRRGVLWVDFEAPPPESDEPVLARSSASTRWRGRIGLRHIQRGRDTCPLGATEDLPEFVSPGFVHPFHQGWIAEMEQARFCQEIITHIQRGRRLSCSSAGSQRPAM